MDKAGDLISTEDWTKIGDDCHAIFIQGFGKLTLHYWQHKQEYWSFLDYMDPDGRFCHDRSGMKIDALSLEEAKAKAFFKVMGVIINRRNELSRLEQAWGELADHIGRLASESINDNKWKGKE